MVYVYFYKRIYKGFISTIYARTICPRLRALFAFEPRSLLLKHRGRTALEISLQCSHHACCGAIVEMQPSRADDLRLLHALRALAPAEHAISEDEEGVFAVLLCDESDGGGGGGGGGGGFDLDVKVTVNKQSVTIGGHLARKAVACGREWALRQLFARPGGAACLVATAGDAVQTPLFLAFHRRHEACCAAIVELVPSQRAPWDELRAELELAAEEAMASAPALDLFDDY